MLGAIAGDIIGSIYEKNPYKRTDFPLFSEGSRFTDDTVLTLAVADGLLNHFSFEKSIKDFAKNYPDAGYGKTFKKWMNGEIVGPYNSWGNGSAMRVSAIAYYCEELKEVLDLAQKTAIVTHNHPEGVKGAQAVATAIYLARTGFGKTMIKDHIQRKFGYDLESKLADIRKEYVFDVSCAGSVPQSIIAFLESDSWESAVRNAVSLGGDADTMASIAGAIAEPFYDGVPEEIKTETLNRLPTEFCDMIEVFYKTYSI